MSKWIALVTAIALVAPTAGCKVEHYVIGGAVVGGTSGGMIGNQIDDDPAGVILGSLTGLVIGAVIGLCVGFEKEDEAAKSDD
jgi:hypothetical protein